MTEVDQAWRQSVGVLCGVGVERAGHLSRLGIRSVGDLLRHRPRRYEDRRHLVKIGAWAVGETGMTRGTIIALGVKRYRRGQRSLFELILEDETGRLHCRWWNQPYLEGHFQARQELIVFGRLSGRKPRTVDHPEVELIEADAETHLHVNRLVPMYPLTEGVSQRWLRSLVWRALGEYGDAGPEPRVEVRPAGMPTRAEAIRQLHFPDNLEEAERARQRLAWDELLALQVDLLRRRRVLAQRARAVSCAGDNRWIRPFLRRLGFALTRAQVRVLREIRHDLAGPVPMRRLLQGDVGSGKTVVAACSILMALESGRHAVLMAPTEVLAEQHYHNFGRWFQRLDLGVELRTGSQTAAMPPDPAASSTAADARPRLVIGTHALIGAGFSLPNLGLVVIDEQHKFGVVQRESLVRKGHYPHLLVMTATPIPRSLALTVYGDLELSVIDEIPAGRGRVRTFVRTADALPRVWQFVRGQLKGGRQAYVVCPRLEDTGELQVKAVAQEYESLKRLLAPHRVGLLHGRMGGAQKDEVMRDFREHRLEVLLATTVVEVGLDIPNATVLVVQNAERYGLAQLHQLRGRVGRATHEAFCILVGEAKTEAARERLHILSETGDGFKIAEADLRLRGPGELLGQQQSGAPSFHFADLVADWDLLKQARQRAGAIVDSEPVPASLPCP
jgi:ATP-dependent DNA helicase RecG